MGLRTLPRPYRFFDDRRPHLVYDAETVRIPTRDWPRARSRGCQQNSSSLRVERRASLTQGGGFSESYQWLASSNIGPNVKHFRTKADLRHGLGQSLLCGPCCHSLPVHECLLSSRGRGAQNGNHLDHIEYNKLFDQEFAHPLMDMGFDFVRKTKSLRYLNDTRDLWIKRIDGKWPHPGVARTAICFRHSFLRPVSSDDPDSKKLVVDDFPRKLTLEDFNGLLKSGLNYRPENSGRWSTSDFAYGNQSCEAVRKRLRTTKRLVETRVLPWVSAISESNELFQISKYGEQAWCERRWIEDYEAFLAAHS